MKEFDRVFEQRILEADLFYDSVCLLFMSFILVFSNITSPDVSTPGFEKTKASHFFLQNFEVCYRMNAKFHKNSVWNSSMFCLCPYITLFCCGKIQYPVMEYLFSQVIKLFHAQLR